MAQPYRLLPLAYWQASINELANAISADGLNRRLNDLGAMDRAFQHSVKCVLQGGTVLLGALATRHGVFPDDENISMATIYENVRVLLTRVIEAAEQGYIDFDDQIYLPLVRSWGFRWYDIIFVDESQDLNRLQHALLAKVLHKGGRVIAVGDRSQAIYGFRGSDTSSMDRLQEQYGAVELPLTVSWRCPKAVIAEAQKYVSRIEPAPNAKEGYVVEAPSWNHEYFQVGDMIVCRLNAPLIEVAYKLILSGVGCRIEGRDIGVGLQNIIRKQKAITINDLVNHLSGWSNRQVQRFQAKDDDDGVQRILDQYESIMAIISAEEHDSPDSVIGAIDRMFPRKKRGEDPKPTIVLSSIHKAKGLEAERVFILNRHLMPLKWAVRDWEKEQENNLIYVAITRAQDTLCYIDLEGYGAGDAQQ